MTDNDKLKAIGLWLIPRAIAGTALILAAKLVAVLGGLILRAV